MAGYNRLTLIGNLIADPELRSTGSGTSVADIRLAVNTTRGSGEKKREETCFIDCTAWARTAEVICDYVKKGDSILLEGRLTFEEWEDRESGNKRSKHKMTIDNFTFLNNLRERGERQSRSRESQKSAKEESFDDDFYGGSDAPF